MPAQQQEGDNGGDEGPMELREHARVGTQLTHRRTCSFTLVVEVCANIIAWQLVKTVSALTLSQAQSATAPFSLQYRQRFNNIEIPTAQPYRPVILLERVSVRCFFVRDRAQQATNDHVESLHAMAHPDAHRRRASPEPRLWLQRSPAE